MSAIRHFVVAVVLGLLTVGAWALPSERVDDFVLLDHDGNAHKLYYQSDARAVVLTAHSASCEVTAAHQAELAAVAGKYADQGVVFLMVNSEGGVHDTLRYNASSAVPILMDRAGVVGDALGFETAGETLIVDPASWRTAYSASSPSSLDEALTAFLDGKPAAAPADSTAAPCALKTAPPLSAVSYADDIAPMLVDNCVTCHREGGIGPWAMTEYNMIRGFAPMIREVVRTKRMPPWHADPMHGTYSNDRSLTDDEVRKLVQWVDAGAPRGDGPDPLATLDVEWPEWAMGEPDVVIDIPAFDVPATGVVEYQYQRVRNPLDRDVWVRATEILPGDRSALHHVITSFFARGDGADRRRRGGLGGYVPGAEPEPYPDGTGTKLPAGATLVFQMHYTPYGKATIDRSQLGLYLHDEPPTHALDGAVLMNNKIRIPPHAPAHPDSAERTFNRDLLLYSLLPHSHYRGKASEFRAHYPDGSEEVLLSVPNYDFNWQTTYRLTEPKLIPAGTRVVHTTWWDNSAKNPANPDPDREVPWGRQSWDEMLFGSMTFRYLEPERTASASEPAADDASD